MSTSRAQAMAALQAQIIEDYNEERGFQEGPEPMYHVLDYYRYYLHLTGEHPEDLGPWSSQLLAAAIRYGNSIHK